MNRTAALALSLMALLGASVTLAGCNTTAGAGQDLSNTGKAISNAADKAKP